MNTNTTINDRIIQFIEHLEMDLDLFAYLCDVNPDVILNENLTDDNTTLNKIFIVYPEVNPKWIKSGVGRMLSSPHISPFNEDDYDTSSEELLRRRLSKSKLIAGIKERLEIYQGYINAMPSKLEKSFFLETLYKSHRTAVKVICNSYTNLSPKWLVYGEGNMVYNWTVFGDAIGAKYKWNKEALSESDKMTAEWALKSFAFRWVEGSAKIGMSASEIIELFNYAHKENPNLMKSRTGDTLSYDVFKIWLRISTKLVPKYISEFLSVNK